MASHKTTSSVRVAEVNSVDKGAMSRRLARAPKPGNKGAAKAEKPVGPAGLQGRGPKLAHQAYEKILSAIVYGRLDLGEPLSENDLARALNLSKAPIRESLSELRLKGLVVVVPQSGTYVFSPTSDQIAELCDYRVLLESRALRTSMQRDAKSLVAALRTIVREMKVAHRDGDLFTSKRLDVEFHLTVIRHSGNRYLIQSYESISHTVEALRHRFMDTAIYRNKAHDEHEKMVDLLAENQVAKAIAVLQDHIARTKQMQSIATWGTGQLRRKDYRFRDYSAIFQ